MPLTILTVLMPESSQRMSELAGLLTGKAMASYANLNVESMNDYPTIRQGIL